MALTDYLKNILGIANNNPQITLPPVPQVGPVPVKTVEVGSTGTEIYAGYISEEYLSELQGKEWADKVDQMRRSDPNVKMIVSALKLPLKSANWYVKTLEDSEMAEFQKALIQKVLFEDLNKSFTKFIGEALTCVDFGYSLFEITYQPKFDDPKIGTYNTVKSVAWRSQRTIERWNVAPDGTLLTVTQMSNGDLGKNVELDSRFLLHFAPDQEGDNFEGISVLRACYGNFLRKNVYLKLMAAGMEKYAIPTPVLSVPEGKDGSPEYKNALNALKCYVSNQANYMTMPQGWELEFNNSNFDAETIITAIEFENKEMVKSILASFLLLGQNGTGSLALSKDLSDFFGQTVTYLADHLIEQITRKLIIPIIKMNLGDEPVKVELVCDSLEDKPTQEWATMIKTLIDSGMVSSDENLKDFVRQKFKLPEANIVEPVVAPEQTPPEQTPPPNAQLAEKKKTKKSTKEADLIRETSSLLKTAGRSYLKNFSRKYIKSVLAAKSKANEPNQIKAPVNANVPSLTEYVKVLKSIGYYNAIEANRIVEKNFNKKPKKLAEFNLANTKFKRVENAFDELYDAFKLLEAAVTPDEVSEAIYIMGRISDKVNLIFGDYLTYEQKQMIDAKAQVLADTQKADAIKPIDFQYQNSLSYATDEQLEQDMIDASEKFISGNSIDVAADVQSSKSTNDAIQTAAEQWSESTGDSIVSWTFVAVDDDVTTELCSELDGWTFEDGSPLVDKYSPPLHFNCRSFLQVNTASMNDLPEIDAGEPKLSKKAQSQIQFGELKKHKSVKK